MTEPAVRNALRAIAATSLSSRLTAVDPFPRGEADLLDAISRERLTGFALTAVQSGSITLSPSACEQLLERHEHQLALDLRLEQLVVEVAGVVDDCGLPYRLLKGPLLAHTVYDAAALRSFGDVDLLVRGGDLDAAIDVLRPLGFERRFLEPRRGFDGRFSKGACLERGDGRELDLHRTLAPGAFGVRLGHIDFFARTPQIIDLGGRAIAGVDPELAFVHACFHAALGDHPPRLVPIRDIVECLRAGIEDATVIDLATSARCEQVFQRAIDLVDIELGVRLEGEIPEWARSYRPTRFDRWALRGYTSASRSYSHQVAASFCALPSLRDRASYAGAIAFPNRAYVRAREGGYARRITRGMRLLHDRVPK
jgi:Uncharacterised nucleotidyltransferase